MSSYRVSILHESKKHRLSAGRLGRVTKQILQWAGVKSGQLDIWLVSDRKIQVLNKRFLKHDRPTDVIAMGQAGGPKLKSGHLPVLGDIVISLDTAQRQALEYGNPFFYEVCFYVCHGVLHILGWEDATVRQRSRMLARQAWILKKIGIKNSPEK